MCSQGRVLRGPAGREQGAAQRDVRGEDHRQEGSKGQRGLFGQRNQSLEKVISSLFLFISRTILLFFSKFSRIPRPVNACTF